MDSGMMELTVRLYGLLRLKFPGYQAEKGIKVTIPAGARLPELLQKLEIEREDVGMIVVNGMVVRDTTIQLTGNQQVEIYSHFPHGG